MYSYENYVRAVKLYIKLIVEHEALQAKRVARMRKYLDSQIATGKRSSFRAVAAALDLHRSNLAVRAAWVTCQEKPD